MHYAFLGYSDSFGTKLKVSDTLPNANVKCKNCKVLIGLRYEIRGLYNFSRQKLTGDTATIKV